MEEFDINWDEVDDEELVELEQDAWTGTRSFENDKNSLQCRIGQLEADVRREREAAIIKSGEAALLRKKQANLVEHYENLIGELKRTHANTLRQVHDEVKNLQRERDCERVTNRFLEHEMNTTSITNSISPSARMHHLPFRDGFDEESSNGPKPVAPSPSTQHHDATDVRVGHKRKRCSDSPGSALTIFPSQGSATVSSAPLRNDALWHDQVTRIRSFLGEFEMQLGANFSFLQLSLHHTFTENFGTSFSKCKRHSGRIFEWLAGLEFPSEPNIQLLTILLNGVRTITTVFNASNTDSQNQLTNVHFRGEFIRIICSLWTRCLDEKFIEPINVLVDLLQFCLSISPISLARDYILEECIVCATRSIDLVAVPRGRAWTKPGCLRGRAEREIEGQINLDSCLTLLKFLAEICATNVTATRRYWTCIKYDFVLVMLMRAQPTQQIIGMLDILCFSTLEDSFGSIDFDYSISPKSRPTDKQEHIENSLLERLLNLLFELPLTRSHIQPVVSQAHINSSCGISQFQDDFPIRGWIKPAVPSPSSSQSDMLKVRMSVLNVLKRLCGYEYSLRRLASHRSTLPALFKLLYTTVNMIYAYPPAHHTLLCSLVNAVVPVIYEIMCIVPHSSNDHHARRAFISMARLAFAQQLILDAPLDLAITDAAHGLLADEYDIATLAPHFLH